MPHREAHFLSKLEHIALGQCIPCTLMRFAVPVIAGTLLMRANTAIDNILVGQTISTIGVAAITLCDPFVLLITALAVLIGDGGSFVIALRLGAGDPNDAAKTAGTAIAAAVFLSLAFAAATTLFADPLLRLAGATDEILPHARPFLQIISWGSLFTAFGAGISSFVRTAGFPSRVLGVQALGVLCTVAFGYLFVIVFGTGTIGAACATAIGQAAAMGATVACLLKRDMPFKVHPSDLMPDMRILLRTMALGFPSSALRMTDAFCNFAMHILVVAFAASTLSGAATTNGALAASGIESIVIAFLLVPGIGIATAARPLIGYCCGADLPRRALAFAQWTLICGFAAMVPLWAAVECMPELFVGMFGIHEDDVSFACWVLQVSALTVPLSMVRIVGTSYFQASGQAGITNALIVLQQGSYVIVKFLAFPFLLPACTQFGHLQSLFLGSIGGSLAAVGITAAFLVREHFVLKEKIAERAR